MLESCSCCVSQPRGRVPDCPNVPPSLGTAVPGVLNETSPLRTRLTVPRVRGEGRVTLAGWPLSSCVQNANGAASNWGRRRSRTSAPTSARSALPAPSSWRAFAPIAAANSFLGRVVRSVADGYAAGAVFALLQEGTGGGTVSGDNSVGRRFSRSGLPFARLPVGPAARQLETSDRGDPCG